jgi:HTH-type transcriptional regulator/antitoxin HigA
MTILNQRDYKSAKARLAQLKAALAPSAVLDDLFSSISAEVAPARQLALKSEVQRLEAEVAAYEKLSSAANTSDEFASDDLGLLPIRVRIARNLSQKDLAELLEVSEQQIQRYERDRYSGISISRYKRVLEVLGVELKPQILASSMRIGADSKTETAGIKLDASIISEIRKRNWATLPKGISIDDAERILANYVSQAAELGRSRTLFRRQLRKDSALDDSAIAIWQSRVLQTASERRAKLKSKFNIVDTRWVTQLAGLTVHPNGPSLALDFLRDRGIIAIIVPALPHTRLDGGAMMLSDGTPIIAITIRHDRLDSFWFTLFHEVGHVLLHFHHGLEDGFFDDFDNESSKQVEQDADKFALSALISDEVWDTAPARFSKSADLVRKMADSLRIHPSIIAGRIRKEREDYTLFRELIGNGALRTALGDHFT